jgi:hypothetical protein
MEARIALVCVVLSAPAAIAAAEPPFSPHLNVPDFVATYVVKTGARTHSRIVTHHAGWVRIDSETDNRRRSTSYHSMSSPLSITISGGAGEDYRYFAIGREKRQSFGWIEERIATGEHDIFLGERCDIWSVSRSERPSASFPWPLRQLSCISHDGIELWNKFVSNNYVGTVTEAVTVDRRPVLPDEVAVPHNLLDLKTWTLDGPPASPASGFPDATVILQASEPIPGQTERRIIRRHGPWISNDDMTAEGRRIVAIRNESKLLSLRFERGPAGELASLSIRQELHPTDEGTVKKYLPVKSDRSETILGETCSWFNMTPGMADAGSSECRTDDGLVLKESRWARGMSFRSLVAISVRRSPLVLTDILPPPEILTRRSWGIPD